MPLSDAELYRIKQHLGYNLLSVGAEPYIGITALFDQVIQPYLTGGAATTSTTAITAADAPTAASLTLASATGFTAGDTCLVDVDSLQERATIRSVSGSTITVLLTLGHAGTYPVVVEGPEALVRSLLRKADEAQTALNTSTTTAGLHSVDNGGVVWFPDGEGSSARVLKRALNHWRDELAAALGIVRLNRPNGGGCVSLY